MEKYLSPAQVCEMVPSLTIDALAQMRYRGDGPRFIKPSARRVVYAESAITEWLNARVHSSTRERVPAEVA